MESFQCMSFHVAYLHHYNNFFVRVYKQYVYKQTKIITSKHTITSKQMTMLDSIRTLCIVTICYSLTENVAQGIIFILSFTAFTWRFTFFYLFGMMSKLNDANSQITLEIMIIPNFISQTISKGPLSLDTLHKRSSPKSSLCHCLSHFRSNL